MNATINQTSPSATITPRFGSIDTWCLLSGMGRRATYDALGHGHLKAVKAGTRTLINIEKGLAWLNLCRRHRFARRNPARLPLNGCRKVRRHVRPG